jgi:MATE family, multidrug efflux pump
MKQTNDKSANTLTLDPIRRLIWKVAIPASIGFFFHTMFNVTDTWFAGRISTEAVAALSLSFPVFFIIISIGSGFATGVTALVGDAFGADNHQGAVEYAAQAVIFGLLVSVLLAFFGLTAAPYLFEWLGASDTYLETSLDYMNIIFLGAVFFMMSFIFNGILNALGETKPNRNFLIVAFFANIMLDPWFIFGGFGLPALGISGVAVATVLCEMGGTVYLGTKAFRSGLFSTLKFSFFYPRVKPMIEIARQGLPAAFSLATVGIGIFIITYFVSRFGQGPVAAFGIAVRIEQLVLLPTIGLNIATLAIVSQNSGANLGDRVQETVALAVKYGGRIMLPAGLVVLLSAKWLMSLFSGDLEVINAGADYLRVDALTLWAYVILFVNVAALQGMKRPMFSVWIGLYRQIVAPALVFWVFAVFLNFRLWGIWWGIFGVTWSAAIVSYIYAGRMIRKTFRDPENV